MNLHSDPVILLHGFLGTSSDWTDVVDRFGSGLSIITPDLPGHGTTPLPSAEPTMRSTVDWLHGIVESSGFQRVVLVGYSMGGRIAMHYALAHPECCSRLVTIAASPGLRAAAGRRARALSDDEWAARIEALEPAEFLRKWYAQPVFRSLRARPELLDKLVERRSSYNPASVAAMLRGLSVGRQPSLWGRLDELPSPTMVMAGTLDGKYVETAQEMAVQAPNVHVSIIQDAGHVVHLESPNAFVQVLGGFLGYLPPA